MPGNNNNDSKFSVDLVSGTCQFCGESFGRGTDLFTSLQGKTLRGNRQRCMTATSSPKAAASLVPQRMPAVASRVCIHVLIRAGIVVGHHFSS
jgi:hypothetical protein